MPNLMKAGVLASLTKRYGPVRKLENTQSLYEIAEGKARFYFRYSRRHAGNRTFFGLRKVDLQALEGHLAVICYLWDAQREPLFVPFHQFEEVFAALTPASDGQYKAQVYEQEGGTELYIANAGRFNVESYFGWSYLESLIRPPETVIPELSHVQVQTLLGGIGAAKGFDIWVPVHDRSGLDWNLASPFGLSETLPAWLTPIKEIAEEIDVIWLDRGGSRTAALYEVEHSTPIYSGLLRFNDVHLMFPSLNVRFGIVSNDNRRSLFVRQLSRPTFKASSLSEVCTFFEYRNVFGWYQRLQTGGQDNA